MSSRRAEWFIRWAEKVTDSPTVQMASFEEGLIRIMFVRPFPGPSIQVPYYAPGECSKTRPTVCLFYFEVPWPVKSQRRGITGTEQRLRLQIVHRVWMLKPVIVALRLVVGSQFVIKQVI